MSDVKCELCGESMPPGEEMFKFHGYSGPCPKPPLPKPQEITDTQRLDWLESQGRIAENNKTARVYAIASYLEWTLREAIDAAMAATPPAPAKEGDNG